jgi:glycosyltransferase involved in cell wall biosynthesis
MKLSIVIPAYNERATIANVLDGVLQVEVIDEHGNQLEKELIVVDDASTDGTSTILSEYALRKEICVYRHESNRGKGAALRTAFSAVTGDIVIIQDADGEYDPGEYPLLIGPILRGHADVVFGSRLSGGQPQRVYMFWHLVGNRLLTLLTNILYNSTLTDMETGFKVFRRDVVNNFRLRESDFRIEAEMTAQVLRNPRLRVYELPISYYGRSYDEGKKITWKDGVWAVLTLFRCRFTSLRG